MTDRQIAEEAIRRLHSLKVDFNMTRILMEDQEARDLAGEVVRETTEFIASARRLLAITAA